MKRDEIGKNLGERNKMSLVDVTKIYEKYSFLFTAEKLPEKKDFPLNELGFLAENFEEFFTNQSIIYSANQCNRSNIIPKLTELIVGFGLVKTFDDAEDRDYDARDFPTEAKEAKECFEYLKSLIKQYGNIDTAGKRKFLVQVILLCATHSSTYFWSSNECVSSSKEFLEKLLESSGFNNLSTLLCDEIFYPTIFKGVLKWMRPVLQKDSWMKNPSSCYIFYWLLTRIKHPHLINYFNDVMPPPFMFTNYFAIPQQKLGIKCFDHILDNMPPSSFKSNGVDDAIFDTLKKYTHSKDIPIIEVLYPCLLKLPMMNLRKVNHLKWFQFDDILQELLTKVDVECDPWLRHLFLVQTHLYIIKAPSCFKHLKKALCVVFQNLTANYVIEEKCRTVALEILKELIRSCWPRTEKHCFDIMLAILKVVCDIENPGYTLDNILSEKVLLSCKECLTLLKCTCPKTFNNFVNEYIQGDESLPGASLLQSIS